MSKDILFSLAISIAVYTLALWRGYIGIAICAIFLSLVIAFFGAVKKRK